jgi:hypothetical protein
MSEIPVVYEPPELTEALEQAARETEEAAEAEAEREREARWFAILLRDD